VIAGWVVTETGRQPWVAEGILRTSRAASPVPAASVATSLTLFVIAYAIVFWFGIFYINRLINRGLGAAQAPQGLPNRPLMAGGGIPSERESG